MNIHQNFSKLSSILVLCFGLFACSEESDPMLEAQKKLEAEAKEIQAKELAKIKFREKTVKI